MVRFELSGNWVWIGGDFVFVGVSGGGVISTISGDVFSDIPGGVSGVIPGRALGVFGRQ